MEVVFIVGSPRSGTTLLQRILSLHSRLCSISGETGIFTRQNLFDRERRHFGLAGADLESLFDDSSDIVDFFERGASRVCDGRIFVEKTPQHVLHIPFILEYFPASRIIHIVRDGRDCYCSARSSGIIPQAASLDGFARYWRKCVRAAMRHQGHERILEIRYEDLARHPRRRLSDIMRYLGLELEDRQTDPDAIGGDRRSDLGEFRRLKQAIGPASVGRWRTELTPRQVARFMKVARREIEHYGYS